MKILLPLTLMMLLAACNQENVPSYNSLNDEERAYIQSQASQKCLADSEKRYIDLAASSNYDLVRMRRGDHWKITIPGTTTNDFMYVWKISGSTVYFLHQEKLGTETYHNFIKMTPAFNADMLANLRVKKCASKVPEITDSNSTFKVKYFDTLSTEGTTKFRTDTTYTGASNQPAFFSLFNQVLFKEKLNTDNTVASTETLTYKIEYVSDAAQLLATYGEYSNKRYCVFKYDNTTPLKTVNFPYTKNCVESGDPNTFGDATLNFLASELNF